MPNDVLDGRFVSVQNQFSPAFRSSEPELQLCHDLDIAFLPWSPLGGISNAPSLGTTHAAFREVAHTLQVSPQQGALAWLLAKSPAVIPIRAPAGRKPSGPRCRHRAATHPDRTARLDAS